MEGNIVFRQGDRTVYADRMFYDVRRQIGIDPQRRAARAAAAGGRLPVPGPRPAQGGRHPAARRLAVRRPGRPASPPAGSKSRATASSRDTITLRRPASSRSSIRSPACRASIRRPASRRSATSTWSRARTTSCTSAACRSSTGRRSPPTSRSRRYYINNVRVRNDSIFGFQALFELDAFQLFGHRRARRRRSGTSTSTT